ncbi:hypothetical protein R3P38DRAFT_3539669, partial [Favolaschia claudopus]
MNDTLPPLTLRYTLTPKAQHSPKNNPPHAPHRRQHDPHRPQKRRREQPSYERRDELGVRGGMAVLVWVLSCMEMPLLGRMESRVEGMTIGGGRGGIVRRRQFRGGGRGRRVWSRGRGRGRRVSRRRTGIHPAFPFLRYRVQPHPPPFPTPIRIPTIPTPKPHPTERTRRSGGSLLAASKPTPYDRHDLTPLRLLPLLHPHPRQQRVRRSY